MNKDLVQSRRGFIKGVSMAALGAAAMGATGIARAETPSNETATSIDEIAWDEEYDVLVVGAGMAGLMSAVTVANEGNGATVLLIEKGSDERGNGNSKFASGLSLSPLEEEVPAFAEYLKTLRGEYLGTPDDYIEAYAQALSEIYPDSLSLGARGDTSSCSPRPCRKWPELETSLDASRKFRFKTDNEDGMNHCTMFLLSCVQNQFSDLITEKTNSPLVALVQDPVTRTIYGGIYENEGKQIYVKANKGVMMCTGGFENDPIMRQKTTSICPSLTPLLANATPETAIASV